MTMKLAMLGVAVLWMGGPSLAGDEPGKTRLVSYFVVQSPVSSLLERLAKDTGMSLRIDEGIELGFVRSQQLTGSVDAILDKITGELGLVYFLYNNTLYISHRDSLTTRIIVHPGHQSGDVRRMLGESGLDFADFPTKPIGDEQSFMITAPPEFAALAEAIIDAMPGASEPPRKSAVVLRRGTEVAE